MLLWLVILLGAYFLFAASNIFDKVLRAKFVRNSYALIALDGIINLLIGILLIILKPSILASPNLWLVMASGAIGSLAGLMYFMALSRSEVSSVVPVFNSIPIFTLVLAAVFLGEVLTLMQLFAFIFILAGSFIISVKRIRGLLKFDRGFWLILLSSLLYAIYFIILKYGLESSNFYTVQALVQVGAFAGAMVILLYAVVFGKVRRSELNFKPRAIWLDGANEAIYFAGRLIYNIALVAVPVAIATAFGGFQALFVLALSILLSLYFSHILEERITRGAIAVKLAALGLMFIGIVLLAYA